jgi:CubicO group peptidase (beta-lactamase class C family)
VEQGRLALDEDVNARLVSWKVPENEFTREKKVTLRGLLSHSAGLTVHGFPGYASTASVPTVVQVLDGAAPANTPPVRVNVAPGTIWRYSGGGITVTQLLMEDVTREPFATFMQRTVLRPLGMVHSTYEQPLPATHARVAASGHERLDTPVPGRFHLYPEMAAAGLWSTPSDLARWAIEVQRAYRGDSRRVLSQDMTRQMLTKQFGEWGLGVQLAGAGDSAMFMHGGRDEGFVADLRAFVHRGQGVVIMTNGVSGRLVAELSRSVANAYGWPVPPRPTRTIGKVEGASLDALVGTYLIPGPRDTTRLRVTREGERLFVQQLGAGPRAELLPEGGLSFFDVDDGSTFRFALDPAAATPTAGTLSVVQGPRTIAATRARP